MAGIEIENGDKAIYFKEPAWHGLGVVFEGDVLTSEIALQQGGLDWKVKQEPLYNANGEKLQLGSYQRVANVIEGTAKCVGIVSPKYKIIQNADAFSTIDDILAEPGMSAKYESAGSLFGQRRVWVLCKLPERSLLDDAVADYLFFDNSHDGTTKLRMGLTSVRIVCNNTLQLALDSAPRVWEMRHNGDIESKKLEVAEALKLTTQYLEMRDKKAEELATKKIDFTKFVEMLYPLKDDATERTKTIVADKREIVTSIYNKRNDLGNFTGTAWGAYQAVSDYVSNYRPVRLSKRFNETRMANFMDGNKDLEKAQKILEAA